MSEFRSALRGVPSYLISGFLAAYLTLQLTRTYGDLSSLLHTSNLAASGVLLCLVFVPGLAAGLTVGGGWRRGLVSSLLGVAAVGVIMSAFMVLLGGLGRTLMFLGGTSAVSAGLAAASMAAGAAGGALQARWRPRLETGGRSISGVLGADRPGPALPRSLVVLQWTRVLLLVLGGNLLYRLGRDRLPPQVFWWAMVVFLGAVLVAFAVIRRRIRKVSP
jgi:hypothetical protein